MTTLRPVVALALLIVFAAALPSARQSGDEQLIREARARSNRAIAAHDLAAIAREWAADLHVVSSTSAQTAGRDANGERMATQFKNRPDTVYVRTPTEIAVNPAWAVASERGDWTGKWTEPDGSSRSAALSSAVAQDQRPVAHPGRAVRAHALQGREVLHSATLKPGCLWWLGANPEKPLGLPVVASADVGNARTRCRHPIGTRETAASFAGLRSRRAPFMGRRVARRAIPI